MDKRTWNDQCYVWSEIFVMINYHLILHSNEWMVWINLSFSPMLNQVEFYFVRKWLEFLITLPWQLCRKFKCLSAFFHEF